MTMQTWKIILKWALDKYDGRGLNSFGSGQKQVAGFCEHGNAHSGLYNMGNVLNSGEVLCSEEGLELHGVKSSVC